MNVSFGSKVAINPETGKKDKNGVHVTKQGNPYYKTNMCKKLYTGVSVGSAALSAVAIGAMTKNPKAALQTFAVMTAKFTIPAIISGAILDGLVNHHSAKKADAMAPYNA